MLHITPSELARMTVDEFDLGCAYIDHLSKPQPQVYQDDE